jgi:hypothetical protein
MLNVEHIELLSLSSEWRSKVARDRNELLGLTFKIAMIKSKGYSVQLIGPQNKVRM